MDFLDFWLSYTLRPSGLGGDAGAVRRGAGDFRFPGMAEMAAARAAEG